MQLYQGPDGGEESGAHGGALKCHPWGPRNRHRVVGPRTQTSLSESVCFGAVCMLSREPVLELGSLVELLVMWEREAQAPAAALGSRLRHSGAV